MHQPTHCSVPVLAAITALVIAIAGCGTDTAPFAPTIDCPEPQAARVEPSSRTRVPLPSSDPLPSRAAESASIAPGANQAPAAVESKSPSPLPELRVRRLVLARGVKQREPIDARTSFRAGETDRVYAFVEVDNRDRQHTEVFVSFEREDAKLPAGKIRLKVGVSPRWRTWAYTRKLDQPGRYQAVVRDASDRVIARAAFDVVGETT